MLCRKDVEPNRTKANAAYVLAQREIENTRREYMEQIKRMDRIFNPEAVRRIHAVAGAFTEIITEVNNEDVKSNSDRRYELISFGYQNYLAVELSP